jgi:hypothetical protein
MQVSDERRKLEMYRSWCDLVDKHWADLKLIDEAIGVKLREEEMAD